MEEKYLVSTGMLIKDYLDEYSINQKTLASRTGMSEKHISNVLNGNSRLTEEFALKLEKVLTNIQASYWLNYEAKYREYLARQDELLKLNELDLKEVSKRFKFREVFKGVDISIVEQAVEMLKLLKISDFSQFENAYGKMTVDFMEDGGEKEAIAIWLNLCESEIEIQNSDLYDQQFEKELLIKNLTKFKVLAYNDDTSKSLLSCKKLCNKLGIYFVECEPITNCKVRGALSTYKGHPAIFISGRFRSHSHIWFAIMHEIAHLVLHYDKKQTLISLEEEKDNPKENEANQFARNIFFSQKDYYKFIQSGNITKSKIIEFAKQKKVLPCFVVAFLKHDGLIEYNQFSYL